MKKKDQDDKPSEAVLAEEAEALQQLIKDTQRQEQKLADKLWRPIEVTGGLADFLSLLTKDELTEIRLRLRLKNVSTLKKQELAALLVEKIPADFWGLAAILFDEERWKWVKKIAEQDYCIVNSQFPEELICYFRRYGLLFSGTFQGQPIILMPPEIKASFKLLNKMELQQLVRRNTEWIYVTQGLLFYYGVLASGSLIGFLEKMGIMEDDDLLSYFEVISEAADCYEQIVLTDRGYEDYRVEDADYIYKEQQNRSELPYYPFLKQQLIKAGKANYIEKSSAADDFVRFMRECYSLTREESEELAEDCWDIINNSQGTGDLIEYLQQGYEFPDQSFVESLMQILTTMHNQTRMWALKGYKPIELVQDEKDQLRPYQAVKEQQEVPVFNIRTGEKIGRNDPCPCNSGKKFKKCCGR